MKKDTANVFFQPTHKEKAQLEAYCKATGRTKTEVLRECIRKLDLAAVSAIEAQQ